MADYIIKYNRDACVGAGTCISICPENYKLDKENKAIVKKTTISDKELQKNIEAARSCPSAAIAIYDKSGKKLAP